MFKLLGYIFTAAILIGVGFCACYFGWFNQLFAWLGSLWG